jgi:hypothetical protein
VVIDLIGVQPIIADAGQGAGSQTYRVGAVTDDGEIAAGPVSCFNELSIPGNMNVVHWQAEAASFRVYRAVDGDFGLIGTTSDPFLIDTGLTPDMTQQPPAS